MAHEEFVGGTVRLAYPRRNVQDSEPDYTQTVVFARLRKQNVLWLAETSSIDRLLKLRSDTLWSQLALQEVLVTVPKVEQLLTVKVRDNFAVSSVHPFWAIRRRGVHGFDR
jgi:hypothetical protein